MTPGAALRALWAAARLRRKRQRLLWRALRARRALRPVADRTRAIAPGAILAFCTLRNEAHRLPEFLAHHRALGVDHFLFVDNGSEDGGPAQIAAAPDCSLWSASGSYRGARFGMDWLGWLLLRHGRGHWCLTLDADELFVYPGCEAAGLRALAARLEGMGAASMGALMLDLYPRGPLGADAERWFDPDGYDWEALPRHRAISIRGGPRKRMFFAQAPQDAPHLHKVPFVRWGARQVYLSSTHTLLPPRLNTVFDPRLGRPTGALLHLKFLGPAPARAAAEQLRAEHFTHPARYDGYYAAVAAAPRLWTPASCRYEGPQQLVALGLMQAGGVAGAPWGQGG